VPHPRLETPGTVVAVEALSPNGVLLEYPWEKGDDEADTNTPSELTNPTPEGIVTTDDEDNPRSADTSLFRRRERG